MKYNTKGAGAMRYSDPTANKAIANLPKAEKKPNKYRNQPVSVLGMKFDSKKEAHRYAELLEKVGTGEISGLECQVAFELIPKLKDERSVVYKADFTYKENGKSVVEDVKSEITRKEKAYVIKRKLLKWRYPDIVFREV